LQTDYFMWYYFSDVQFSVHKELHTIDRSDRNTHTPV